MVVARSFDINKPGAEIQKIVGGVLGGSLKQGVLKKGEEIEIRPGYEVEERNQKIWKPLTTKIMDIKTGGGSVEQAGPGGSIGVMTNLDPSVVKSDKLTGNLVGVPGKLPTVWQKLTLKTSLLERVVGAAEELKVNVNSAATVGIVMELHKDSIKCTLKLPVCAEKGSRVTISRRIGNRFRLIGYGTIEE